MGCGPSNNAGKSDGTHEVPASPYTRPPIREATVITTANLKACAAEHNLALREVNILWLRFKLLGPSSGGLVTACSFDSSIGTGFRHNAVLSKFVKTKFLDDDSLDFESFIRLLKWWKLSDAPEKLRCIFDLYDHDEDRTLTAEETAEMLAALCHGDPNGSSLCSTLQQLVLEHDEDSGQMICKKPVFIQALEEFEDLHRDILCLTDDRVFDSKGDQKNTGIMRSKTMPTKVAVS
eukprot:m.224006 g.224006  ORF g.224006 m.224006 type:complete len:235 (-) comp25865_c2_seq7:2459-3163(-)